MSGTAQLRAEYIVFADFGRCKPKVRDHSGYQIHLGTDLGNIKIMQYVLGSEHHFHRPTDRQMHLGASHQDIVLAVGIIRIQSQRVTGVDVTRIHRT